MFPATNTGATDLDLARFATAKAHEIREFADTTTNKVPALVWSFFDAVRVDDWETATNLADRLSLASGRYVKSATNETLSPALRTVIWPPISEMIGTYEQFHNWDTKWLHRFGREIIESIPRDGIYFGGTDPGRFIITALAESRREEKPFFILTQNQLVDESYLARQRRLYSKQLHLPAQLALPGAPGKRPQKRSRRVHSALAGPSAPLPPPSVLAGAFLAFLRSSADGDHQDACQTARFPLVRRPWHGREHHLSRWRVGAQGCSLPRFRLCSVAPPRRRGPLPTALAPPAAPVHVSQSRPTTTRSTTMLVKTSLRLDPDNAYFPDLLKSLSQ